MDCEQINELGYGEFSKLLHSKPVGERIPLTGSIDITSRCNLRCVHCYIEGTPLGEEHELTYEETCHIFDEIADAGCLWLLITGGEPLLRRDFTDIYRYAKRKGFLITLFTNGTLLTPQIADLLQEEPPFRIEVSLYGMTAGTYERITGIPGSWQRCIRGINLLVERKLPLKIKTMAMTLNYHEINDMREYAKSLGLEFKYDPSINAGLPGAKNPVALRLSPQDVIKLDLSSGEMVAKYRKECDALCDLPRNTELTNRIFQCGAGRNSFHITSTGDLVECILSRKTNYSLLKGTFHEGFYEAIPKIFDLKRTSYSECASCPLANICGYCAAVAELETGDPEAKLEWYCEVAKLRAAAFKTGWAEMAEAKL